MTIRALIVDDEKGSRDTLAMLLREHCPDVEIAGFADSPASGIEAIAQHNPNLVFLDIHMPLGSGFDLLNSLEHRSFELVFTTAYDRYAIRAIRYSALDYLLKPIDYTELAEAVMRARVRITATASASQVKSQVDILLGSLSSGTLPERIALPTSEGMEFIVVSDIVRCEAAANYTTFYLLGGEKLLVTRTLKDFETLLADYNFFRVHKAHLINLSHVQKYMRTEGGQLIMADNSVVEISRRRRDELFEMLARVVRSS